MQGLSPRVRGNPSGAWRDSAQEGSIPARAGQPFWRLAGQRPRGAYPRACGATFQQAEVVGHGWGLSPRVRGNPAVPHSCAPTIGPIPARAGQPVMAPPVAMTMKAYPRACGATHHRGNQRAQQRGLSPRVRGNPCNNPGYYCPQGPIPARAGQPAARQPSPRRPGAYPRACGATRHRCLFLQQLEGLSPRVRGNRGDVALGQGAVGPIPARAGQPLPGGRGRCRSKAYPRACGATQVMLNRTSPMVGLSPRVRGNLSPTRCGFSRRGPIPARAGQPAKSTHGGVPVRAYPRACGATFWVSIVVTFLVGLSPRVRGNHSQPNLQPDP